MTMVVYDDSGVDYDSASSTYDTSGVTPPVTPPAGLPNTITFGIDTLFDDPWFTGTSPISSEVPGVYQVAIAGRGFIIEPTKYQRQTVPLRRESTDESVEPGEQTLNTGGAWPRSQDNWFLGAGQMFLDNRFGFVSVYTNSGEYPSVRTRFWRSKGVNPWGEGELSLLPEYSLAKTSASGTPMVQGVSTYLFYWDGTTLYSTASPGTVTPTWSAITAPAGSGSWPTIQSMTTDGINLYCGCGTSGVVKVVSGATTSSYLRPTAPTPTVAPIGATGSTSYEYFIVAVDANGYKSLAGSGTTITNGNASLATGNNLVSWTAVSGAVSYDVLRGDTAHSIATGVTTTSFTDNGTNGSGSPVSYTAPTATTENFAATFVNYGNSFLVGGAGPQLVSVAANGMTTEVMTHFNPSFTWNAGCGSTVAIYVAGSAGNNSELYGIQLSTTTFGLGAPFIAGQVTIGEIINDVTYYQGIVVIATSLGVRAAQDTNSDGHLTIGAVINSLGGSNCLAAFGPYVWFGTSNFMEDDGIYTGNAESSGLGRLFLSEFSSALLPGYATDVMTTNGISGSATSVTIVAGVPYFCVINSGVWQPSGNVVPYGYLESGYVRYGTTEDKILITVDFRHDPLPADCSVQIEVVPFGGASFSTAANTVTGSIGPPSIISADDFVGEGFEIIPIMKRSTSDPTKGPVLRRWTARAMVVALRQDQIVVPIIWERTVLNPQGDGIPLAFDLQANWLFLKDLEENGTLFLYQEGALSYNCVIDEIIEDEMLGWDDQKQMLRGILKVQLLTVS